MSKSSSYSESQKAFDKENDAIQNAEYDLKEVFSSQLRIVHIMLVIIV
jgi:hypothetical protein